MKYLPIFAVLLGLFAVHGASCSSDAPVDNGQGGAGGDDWGNGPGPTTGSMTTSSGMTCKPGGTPCQAFSECCSGTCAAQVCTACGAQGQSCAGTADCCQSLTCYNGTCGACLLDFETCTLASDCCSNICFQGTCSPCKQVLAGCSTSAECCGGNLCAGGVCCAQAGQACSFDGECCMGTCSNGFCGGTACKPNGQPCAANAECCAMTCVGSICGGTACKPNGQSCVAHAECCGMSCVGGVCGGTPCGGQGTACSSSSQCCSPLMCLGGICTTPSSPCDNTGICGDIATPGGCSSCAIMGACATQFNACFANTDCFNYLNCFFTCGGGPACQSSCGSQYPAGAAQGNALGQCVYCQQCPNDCAGMVVCP